MVHQVAERRGSSRMARPFRHPQSDSAPSILGESRTNGNGENINAVAEATVTAAETGREPDIRSGTGPKGTVNLSAPNPNQKASSEPRTSIDLANATRSHRAPIPQTYGFTSAVPRRTSRHKRVTSPKIKWRHTYNESTQQKPRVLILDYYWDGEGDLKKCRVRSYEYNRVEQIKRLYRNRGRTDESILRVFHVQNFRDATEYLLGKFMIRDDVAPLIRSNFGRYVLQPKPDRRGGSPKPSSRTWDTEHDPWRGISKTSLLVDYLRYYDVSGADSDFCEPDAHEHRYSRAKAAEVKVMELNGYTEQDDPTYKYDVCVQRSGLYVQYRNSSVANTDDGETENPYQVPLRVPAGRKANYIPDLDNLDNGNAIIFFDDSMSGNIYDTLIPARRGLEDRWRRVLFHLGTETSSPIQNSELGFECMKAITDDYFKRGLKLAWKSLLERSYEHVSILQNKIFEEPADESRAPELWTNSAMWLVLDKTLARQKTATEDMQAYLSKLTEGDEPLMAENMWLKNAPEELLKIDKSIQEDLVRPTSQLADLMYKSVGIRDSRHGLQLNTSVWRLSWITFVFLPLTFLVGFFGMNVDVFKENPGIKWYFISAVPFVILILIIYNTFTWILSKARRASPYQRGVYENLFLGLAARNPELWSRNGPRTSDEMGDVKLPGMIARIKWWLIRRWTRQPADDLRRQRQLLSSQGRDEEGENDQSSRGEDDAVATWAGMQRTLIRRWTRQLDRQMDHRARRAGDEEAGQPMINITYPSEGNSQDIAGHRIHHAKFLPFLPFRHTDAQAPLKYTSMPGSGRPGEYTIVTANDAPGFATRPYAYTPNHEFSFLNPRVGAIRTESDPSLPPRQSEPEPPIIRDPATYARMTLDMTPPPKPSGSPPAVAYTATPSAAVRLDARAARAASSRRGPRSSFSAGSDTASEAMIEETFEDWLAHRPGGGLRARQHRSEMPEGFDRSRGWINGAGPRGRVRGRDRMGSGERGATVLRRHGALWAMDSVSGVGAQFEGQSENESSDEEQEMMGTGAVQMSDGSVRAERGAVYEAGHLASRSQGRDRVRPSGRTDSGSDGDGDGTGVEIVRVSSADADADADVDADGIPDRVEDARQMLRVRERNEEREDGAWEEHGKGSMTLY